ncbi:SWIB/MDM2 domain-containing protein, partial [Cynara cardunculus var. scolymus]
LHRDLLLIFLETEQTAKDLKNQPATSYRRRKNTLPIHLIWLLLRRKPPLSTVKMLPQRMKKAVTDNPKKLATLIDLVNLPSTLREFVGQSQSSRLGCFRRVWSHIKDNNLQVELAELPMLIKLHFPKAQN